MQLKPKSNCEREKTLSVKQITSRSSWIWQEVLWGQAAAFWQGIGPRQVNLWQSVNHPRYYRHRLLMPQLRECSLLRALGFSSSPPRFTQLFRLAIPAIGFAPPLSWASQFLFVFFCFPALRLFVRKLLLICGNVNAELCTKLVKFLARRLDLALRIKRHVTPKVLSWK